MTGLVLVRSPPRALNRWVSSALVFAARYADIDTNWSWLTRPNNSMLVSLSNLRLIAHIRWGQLHLSPTLPCGLRMVLLQRDISQPTANRLALALITVGVVVSSVILVALLNVHIA